jgi:hypothetical protein
VRLQLFKILRPILLGIPELGRYSKGVLLTDDQYMEREFFYIFTDPQTGGYDPNN